LHGPLPGEPSVVDTAAPSPPAPRTDVAPDACRASFGRRWHGGWIACRDPWRLQAGRSWFGDCGEPDTRPDPHPDPSLPALGSPRLPWLRTGGRVAFLGSGEASLPPLPRSCAPSAQQGLEDTMALCGEGVRGRGQCGSLALPSSEAWVELEGRGRAQDQPREIRVQRIQQVVVF